MVFSFNICTVYILNVMHTVQQIYIFIDSKKSLILDIYIQRRKHFTMNCFVLLLRLKIRTFINLTTKTSTRKGGDDRISLLRQPHSNFFHIRLKPMMKKVIDLKTCITFQKLSQKKVLSYHFFMYKLWCQTFNNDLDKTPLLE